MALQTPPRGPAFPFKNRNYFKLWYISYMSSVEQQLQSTLKKICQSVDNMMKLASALESAERQST